MKSIELVVLIIAYSTIIISIFVSLICYRRNIEKWETIAFSVSVLLLIVSMTTPYFVGEPSAKETTNISTLLAMILLSLTTPLDVMVERQHSITPIWKKLLYGITALLFMTTGIAYFTNTLIYVEYIIVVWLAASVICSMLLAATTKPQKSVAHLEKTSRLFALVFLILVPLSLLATYALANTAYDMKIGITLPVVFILLFVYKLSDNLQRLSLINPEVEPTEQHFKNYELTNREKEIAALLAKGKTYKQIAEELFISMPTVKTHASNIYRKCKVSNRHELTILITN